MAEVLITLGIIGIVAALVMPGVIKYYQHKALESQFKTAYSLLQNAFVSNRAENPNLYNEMRAVHNNIGANNIMKPLLIEKLDTVKDAGRNGLISTFAAMYKNYYNKAKSNGGWGNYGQIVLKNGMILYTECSLGCATIHVFIDVNGFKGPNRNGHDLFDFQLNSNNQLVPATNFGKNCNLEETNVSAGFDCTAQALNDPDYFKNLP